MANSINKIKSKEIKKFFVVASSIALFLLNTKDTLFSLASSVPLGIIAGLIIWNIHIYNTEYNKWIPLLSVILSGYLVFDCLFVFYNSWIGNNTLCGLIVSFGFDPERNIRIFSYCLSIASFFCFYCITKSITTFLFNVIRTIEWRKVFVVDTSRFFKKTTIFLMCIANVLIGVTFGFILLTIAINLPKESIIKNVSRSARTISVEGRYPVLSKFCTSKLDNHTDSIMLLEASESYSDDVIGNALMIYRGSIEDRNPNEVLVEHFINGRDYTGITEYARYWHGYHIFLDPLLEVMEYKDIRVLNFIVQILLIFIVCLIMKRKSMDDYIIPYILLYLMMMPIAMAKSLQFSSCFYIMSLGVVMVLLLDNSLEKYSWLLFLNIGILTAYLDFLTYPILTFGIPAIFLIVKSKRKCLELKLQSLVFCGLSWCIGYGCMWASKWVLSSLLCDVNVIGNAIGVLKTRTSITSSGGINGRYSIVNCIWKNYRDFLFTPVTIMLVTYCFNNYKSNNNHYKCDEILRKITPYVLLFCAPIAWYIFAINHSVIHHFFTNKACSVSLFSILCFLIECKKDGYLK